MFTSETLALAGEFVFKSEGKHEKTNLKPLQKKDAQILLEIPLKSLR